MSKPKPTPKTSDKRRHFDAAFKLQSAQLAKQIGFRQAAADLGVSEGNLRNWEKAVSTHGQLAFAPLAKRDDVASEVKHLREENRILKMERDILKKATAFFAKNPG
jgi:transposase